MTSTPGFDCQSCGSHHDTLPFSFHSLAPAAWSRALERDRRSRLGEEQCIVRGEHWFVRGLVTIPVVDAEEDFSWGVWTSLSKDSFDRMTGMWETEGREREEPYFGWLDVDLPAYPVSTLAMATNVHTQPLGFRPEIELEPTDHPLAVEQRDGITVARVREIAALLLHGQRAPR